MEEVDAIQFPLHLAQRLRGWPAYTGYEVTAVNNCPPEYKFATYERDGESGLDYAVFRHYNSRLGRFMSPDPLGGDAASPQSLNRYAYVGNNPLNAVDPSGLKLVDCSYDGCGPPCYMCGGYGGPGPGNYGGGPPAGVYEPPMNGPLGRNYYENLPNYLNMVNKPSGPGWVPVGPGDTDLIGCMMNIITDEMWCPATAANLANTSPGGGLSTTGGTAANNGTWPIVPANPCNRAGNAPDPSVYQAKGQAASTNEIKDWYYLFQFRAGGGLDAQPQGASPAYANYVYGVYMSAAGYTLNQALSGADWYAQHFSSYRPGTVMSPNYPFMPEANVMNITYGFTAQQMGTLCHK